MKRLSFLVLLMYITISAQNQRFVYEYKYYPDSTQKEKQNVEFLNLDVSKKTSLFYSGEVKERDSLVRSIVNQQLKSGSTNINLTGLGAPKGKIRFYVSKDYSSMDTYLHTALGRDRYNVKDSRNMNWKILPDKQKIGDWDTQKAETEFAGRKWTAWFTPEIPIQDGPYKFRGLPGLIVLIEDYTQSHRFELKEVKKLNHETKMEDLAHGREIGINLHQYKKVLKDYEENPIKPVQTGSGTIVVSSFTTPSGQQPKPKEMEEKIRAQIRRDNNKLELIVD